MKGSEHHRGSAWLWACEWRNPHHRHRTLPVVWKEQESYSRWGNMSNPKVCVFLLSSSTLCRYIFIYVHCFCFPTVCLWSEETCPPSFAFLNPWARSETWCSASTSISLVSWPLKSSATKRRPRLSQCCPTAALTGIGVTDSREPIYTAIEHLMWLVAVLQWVQNHHRRPKSGLGVQNCHSFQTQRIPPQTCFNCMNCKPLLLLIYLNSD